MDFAPEATIEQEVVLDGGAKKHHHKKHSPKKHHKKHSPKKHSPKKHSPKRKLSSPLRKWNQAVMEATGSRRPLRKNDAGYREAKRIYASMRR